MKNKTLRNWEPTCPELFVESTRGNKKEEKEDDWYV